jgi:LPS-assembly protein|tara:strand:- start:197 stop:2329 length:2133 start_codon:yes stop_codon:yes gene_type:complete
VRLNLAIIFIMFSSLSAVAENITNLIADEIKINQAGELVASGAVTVWYEDRKVTASSITYASQNDKLIIRGPIRIIDNQSTMILGDQAELSEDLKVGIIKSAKIILGYQVQIAAAKVLQKDARYSEAFNIAATSCHVCLNKTPLWQIRARKIVQDKFEKQIYFEHAQLRVLDIPVFYLPFMRLPDPSLKRATGLLAPKLKTSSVLNTGIKIPYFIRLNKHKDFTITPFYSPKTKTIEYRYRQAYTSGFMLIEGALTRDALIPNKNRGYILSDTSLILQNGYNLGIQLQAVSDPSYLFEYDFAQLDRLNTKLELSRSMRYQNSEVKLSNYHSLRENENNATQPTLVAEGAIESRLNPDMIKGEIGLEANFLKSYRYSDLNNDGPDSDTLVDGYDTTRLSLLSNWDHGWEIANGIILHFENEFGLSQYYVQQHADIGPKATRMFGVGAVGLRWPWYRINSNGGIGIVEPQIQLVRSVSSNSAVPNDDSTQVEFDEGNLFRLNRAPGLDLIENGSRLNVGLAGSQFMDSGSNLSWKIGRVLRSEALSTFPSGSGLSNSISDWLLATNFQQKNGIELINRALIASDGVVTKSETSLKVNRNQHQIRATHVELTKDSNISQNQSLSSVALEWNYNLNSNWRSDSKFQFDSNIGRLSKLELGLRYENECVNVDLSSSRSFSTSSTLIDKTDFTLSVELTGFSSSDRKNAKSHKCGV